MASIILRALATAALLAIYTVCATIIHTIGTLTAGAAAGGQFENNDIGYVKIVALVNVNNWAQAVILFMALLFIAIVWWAPVRRAVLAAAAAVLLLAVQPHDASAFFEKTDRTEAYTIMPNESAFWIPDVGNNKDTQASLESEAYLNQNKLAVKRFIIPHAKLGNSGGYMGWDYYVPTGRLIILDRTPFSREWVDADDRGTSKLKEGFPCQSKEGLNIIVGVSIGASVHERDAAKFLYRFGVTPPKGDRTSGEVIFTSVYYGRSLKEVMDDVGRKKVQTLVCAEISARTFDQANAAANEIMAATEKSVREYFTAVGVTLDFIGWGDTFEFDKDIQKVVNDKYAAQTMAPLLATLEALANLKVQEGLGTGLASKGLPVVVTPGMMEAITGLANKGSVP